MPCPLGTDVPRAATILRSGGLVAFATETVYGLGVNALDPAAVAQVFAVKERPRFDPLIVHVADVAWLERLTTRVPPVARALTERFWPGPLTLVLPKTEIVPGLVTAGLPTVAVRVPDHPLALDLLRECALPLAAPSANPFGRISPTRAEHVAEQLGERIDYILDGGPCRVGVESTVVQVPAEDGPALLLRPGGLPAEAIEALTGPLIIPAPSDRPELHAPASPGRLPSHYAPHTPLVLAEENAALPEGRLGLLTLTRPANADRFTAVEVLSPTGDLTEAAAGFFAALRRLDAAGLDLIVARPVPEEGLGRAINDRLRRAAGSQRR
ncbi:MAG: L-threonylcarbamoyladenylate synthase [Planctomycetaceae bacterium]